MFVSHLNFIRFSLVLGLFLSPLLSLYAVTPIEVSKTIKETPKTVDLQALIQEAELGNKEAQARLGYLYTRGQGVTKNITKAVYWLRKAVEQNHVGSQCLLGIMYLKGVEGLPKDNKKAVYLLLKSAEQEMPLAQLCLGRIYYNGEVVPQDYQRAFYWLNKATQNGNIEAPAILGSMYFHGAGVPKNTEKALFWMTASAKRGYSNAQIMVANLYAYLGNYKLAYVWFSIITLQGELENQIKRDHLASKLSTKQLAEAQQVARSIHQQIEKNTSKVIAGDYTFIAEMLNNLSEEDGNSDFSPYFAGVTQRIKRNFNSPSEDNTLKSVVVFTISRSGSVSGVRILHSSGLLSFDDAALSAVQASSPFRSFPPEVEKSSIEVRLTFPDVEIELDTVSN